MQTTTKPTAPKPTLTDIYQRTHAGAVLLGAAIADQQLKNALLTKMRKLSRKLEKELFTGYGPLSSLSAKIALAYALGLIDNITRSRLTVARKVRNEFAHAEDVITFQHPEIRRLLARFPPDCDTGAKNEFLYMWHLVQVESHLVSIAGPHIRKSIGASATKA
jgi:hypothetical protein